jgi:hypothetical protein
VLLYSAKDFATARILYEAGEADTADGAGVVRFSFTCSVVRNPDNRASGCEEHDDHGGVAQLVGFLS